MILLYCKALYIFIIYYLLNIFNIINRIIKYPSVYKLNMQSQIILFLIILTSMFYYTGLLDYFNVYFFIKVKPIFIFICLIYLSYLLSNLFIRLYNLFKCIHLFKVMNESKIVKVGYYFTSLLSISISLFIINRIGERFILINSEFILLLLILSLLLSIIFFIDYISQALPSDKGIVINNPKGKGFTHQLSIKRSTFILVYFMILLYFYVKAVIPSISLLLDNILFNNENNLKSLFKYSTTHLFDESNNGNDSDETVTEENKNKQKSNDNNQSNFQENKVKDMLNKNNQVNLQYVETKNNINVQSNEQKVTKPLSYKSYVKSHPLNLNNILNKEVMIDVNKQLFTKMSLKSIVLNHFNNYELFSFNLLNNDVTSFRL